MNTRGIGLTAALIAALALAGCTTTRAEFASPSTGGPVTAAPITQAPSTASSTAAAGTDSDYLTSVRVRWRGTVPDDTALLAARESACQQLGSGKAKDAVVVVIGSGDDATWNNQRIVNAAIQYRCPQFG